jgi:tRNA-dihydrouridine synthase
MSEKKIITPSVSVKHRLGVRDACTFDGEIDRQKSDDEAFEECRSFVRTVSMSGAVSKFQVHARLGLLGEFLDNQEYTDKEEDVFTVKQHYKLWVPNSSNVTIGNDVKRTKIDHKRVQIQAKRRAKRATLLNRNVPPLRPDVVHRIADEFPDLKFVSNGGINSFEQVKDLINASRNEVIGAMVGRSVINHPCSFAHVDSLWGDNSITPMPTRGDVLENYIQYCDAEEFRVTSMGVSSLYLENMRKRLIAVPFHLFSGEVGSDVFQRQLKKLRDKTDRLKASSILSAAATFVPTETMHRKINEYLSWQQIEQYRNSAVRGSAMQRVIY